MCNSSRKPVILLMLFYVIIGGATAYRYKRIIGGSDVAPNDVPKYVVRLKIYPNGKGREYRCGGTILSSRHILTLGDCLRGNDNVTVYSGAREADDANAVVSGFSRLSSPVHFNPITGNLQSDIGIVVLDKALNLSDGRHAVLGLPTKPPPEDGTNVTIFGWGFIGDLPPSRKNYDFSSVEPKFLKKGTLVMANAECKYPTSVAFCTKATDASPYIGDHGSPIVYGGEVIGIHSENNWYGEKVARHINVYHYRKSIASYMNEYQYQGKYY